MKVTFGKNTKTIEQLEPGACFVLSDTPLVFMKLNFRGSIGCNVRNDCEFATQLSDGVVNSFDPNCEVIPVDAEVSCRYAS